MKYGFKMIRNTQTGEIEIGLVESLPSQAKEYFHRRTGYVEALNVYPAKKTAEEAREQELFVRKCAMLSPEERRTLLIQKTEEARLPARHISDLTGTARRMIYAVSKREVICPPRLLARVCILADRLNAVYQTSLNNLPDLEERLGNPTMSRGGRPDIWKSNNAQYSRRRAR